MRNRCWVQGRRPTYGISTALQRQVQKLSSPHNEPFMKPPHLHAQHELKCHRWRRLVRRSNHSDCVRRCKTRNRSCYVTRTRPWQHVLSSSDSHTARLMHDLNHVGSWNLGHPKQRFIRLKMLSWKHQCLGIGNGIHEPRMISPRSDVTLNCDKSRDFLQWLPRWDFPKRYVKPSRYRAHLKVNQSLI